MTAAATHPFPRKTCNVHGSLPRGGGLGWGQQTNSLPLWGRAGVGAANKPRSDKTQTTTTSPFTYTLGAVDNSTTKLLSLWERGWGEGCECEKCRHLFINNTAHPLPNPPPGPMQNADAFCMGTRPLRASPCRGGGLFNCQHALSVQAYVKSPIACALAHRHLPPPPATGRIP